ncbi:MAG: acyl-CoA reductase, partial [Sphingobacteriaceae bacterium]
QTSDQEWEAVKERAAMENGWFIPAFVALSANAAATAFLSAEALDKVIAQYAIPEENKQPKTVGIVMAGNLPMVGFHDLLCGFMSGHIVYIKLSSKDDVLMRHIIDKLVEWQPQVAEQIHIADMLKGCEAFIATGSNNSARYFEQYFAKYPHIIRKNRTSVAVLDGKETPEELHALGKDIFSYFGLGCRNVTQVLLPEGYDISKIFDALAPYQNIINHHKYNNNFDYHLAIYLLNKVPYMTNDFLLMVENEMQFSAVSVLHYKYYHNIKEISALLNDDNIQCVVGHNHLKFGKSQIPNLNDYADGIDTLAFLQTL